jgi:hypothetical protein
MLKGARPMARARERPGELVCKDPGRWSYLGLEGMVLWRQSRKTELKLEELGPEIQRMGFQRRNQAPESSAGAIM